MPSLVSVPGTSLTAEQVLPRTMGSPATGSRLAATRPAPAGEIMEQPLWTATPSGSPASTLLAHATTRLGVAHSSRADRGTTCWEAALARREAPTSGPRLVGIGTALSVG